MSNNYQHATDEHYLVLPEPGCPEARAKEFGESIERARSSCPGLQHSEKLFPYAFPRKGSSTEPEGVVRLTLREIHAQLFPNMSHPGPTVIFD